jgi:hypothetical protein
MIASFFNVIAWDDLFVETLFQMAAYINSKKTASDAVGAPRLLSTSLVWRAFRRMSA